MLDKKIEKLILKQMKCLDFVIQIDEDGASHDELYDENNNEVEGCFEQLNFDGVTVDDRFEVLDTEKVEQLTLLLNKDERIPKLVVNFERMDAYPDGSSSYMVSIYEPI